jgi:hypothetical protein
MPPVRMSDMQRRRQDMQVQWLREAIATLAVAISVLGRRL